MGLTNEFVTIAVNGCLKIENYPEWWGTRPLRLHATTGSGFPVTARIVNACAGLDERLTFSAEWQAQVVASTSAACVTLIDLEGTSDAMIRWTYYGG